MICPATATRTGHSTKMRNEVHAVDTTTGHPLCTNTLIAIRHVLAPATIHNITCDKCAKKLNPLAINPWKPVRIERVA